MSAGRYPEFLEFAPLTVAALSHCFTLRTAPPARAPVFPFAGARHVQAEQVHGHLTVSVGAADHDRVIPGADALITDTPRLTLAVRVADCGPVYFFDPARNAIGLAHAGKKGTALNITGVTVSAMTQHFGTRPRDLVVVLGPCIRPPHYEIDFAADIHRQARAAGVVNFYDCGLDTAADRDRFYSYRMEQGRTGRHYAFLMLNGPPSPAPATTISPAGKSSRRK
ncbi:MAG: polyphenol oxidase family protein [Verrucomicrobiales bacterium]|jgi:copper oxidase (laccase) domain-containing protein|nr:polyphenol oxidase family protein [Verrucomicrobiales bacterium]